MKKKIFVIALAICVLCSVFASANEDTLFNVIPYDFDVLINGFKLKTESPVLLVDGVTYVPLRDLAESSYMYVTWDEENKEIRLTEDEDKNIKDKYYGYFENDVFYEAFGFMPPSTATDEHWAFKRMLRDMYVTAKFHFEESDLEYVKREVDKISRLLTEKEVEDYERYGYNEVLSYDSEFLDWWDVPQLNDAEYVYHGFMDGVDVMTLDVWALICKAPDSDGYYLYIQN